MEKNHTPSNTSLIIAKVSPLYDYWQSPQNDQDEKRRLEKANTTSPASILFREEPYKWEMLYQSIIREINRGDKDSIKGLRMLISMISLEEQERVLQDLSDKILFSDEIICELKDKSTNISTTKKNRVRFIKILFAIFTNPYRIEIKRKKKHIYERTGSFFNSFKKWL